MVVILYLLKRNIKSEVSANNNLDFKITYTGA